MKTKMGNNDHRYILNLSRNRITSFTRVFKCCPPLQLFDANENHICESMEHYFVGSETTLARVNLANNKRIDTIRVRSKI